MLFFLFENIYEDYVNLTNVFVHIMRPAGRCISRRLLYTESLERLIGHNDIRMLG